MMCSFSLICINGNISSDIILKALELLVTLLVVTAYRSKKIIFICMFLLTPNHIYYDISPQ